MRSKESVRKNLIYYAAFKPIGRSETGGVNGYLPFCALVARDYTSSALLFYDKKLPLIARIPEIVPVKTLAERYFGIVKAIPLKPFARRELYFVYTVIAVV